MKRLTAAFTAILILALSLASCSSQEEETELYYPAAQDFASIDPQVAKADSSRLIAYNCYEGLVALDGNGEICPAAADSWSVSSDSLTYTFSLRRDAKWYLTNTSKEELSGEGEANLLADFDERVTAHDFVFGITRALSPETGSEEGALLSMIAGGSEVLSGAKSPSELGVTAIDDYTLEIRLDRADPDFLYYLTRLAAMPCNEVFFNACKGRYGISMEYMLCNGAYMVYRWSAQSFIRLEKNPLYTGERTAKNDRVWVYYLEDQTALADRIEQGDYQAGFISALSAQELIGKRGYTLTPRSDVVWGYWFNCADSSFASTQLRQAFASSCDRSVLVAPEYIEGTVDRLLTNAVSPYYDYSPQLIPYNEEQAAEYFRLAAQSNDELSSVSVTVLTCPDFEDCVKRQIQIWQRVLGIDVKISVAERDEAVALMNGGSYQIAFLPVEIEYSSAAELFGSFVSLAPGNVTGYSNANYDDLISSTNASMSDEELTEVFKSCEQTLITYAAVIPAFTEATYFAMGRGVEGICVRSSSEVYFRDATVR